MHLSITETIPKILQNHITWSFSQNIYANNRTFFNLHRSEALHCNFYELSFSELNDQFVFFCSASIYINHIFLDNDRTYLFIHFIKKLSGLRNLEFHSSDVKMR